MIIVAASFGVEAQCLAQSARQLAKPDEAGGLRGQHPWVQSSTMFQPLVILTRIALSYKRGVTALGPAAGPLTLCSAAFEACCSEPSRQHDHAHRATISSYAGD
jgi:hypothetical protein